MNQQPHLGVKASFQASVSSRVRLCLQRISKVPPSLKLGLDIIVAAILSLEPFLVLFLVFRPAGIAQSSHLDVLPTCGFSACF